MAIVASEKRNSTTDSGAPLFCCRFCFFSFFLFSLESFLLLLRLLRRVPEPLVLMAEGREGGRCVERDGEEEEEEEVEEEVEEEEEEAAKQFETDVRRAAPPSNH